jgi:large subunit ribosomal protein L29
MKVTKIKQELKQLDSKQLQEKLENLRRELFSVRLNAQTSHMKDYSQFTRIRKDIARVLTFMKQKDMQENEIKQ